MSSEIVNEQFYQQRMQSDVPQQQQFASGSSYNKGKIPRQDLRDEPSTFAKMISEGRTALLARSAQRNPSQCKFTREIAALIAANHLIRASGIRTLGKDWFYYRKHFTEDEISRIYSQFQKWDTDQTGWISSDTAINDVYAFDGIANSSKWREALNRNSGNTISYGALLGLLSSVKISPITRSPGKYFHQEQWTMKKPITATSAYASHHYMSMQEISLLAEFVNKMLEGNNSIQGILPLNYRSRVFFLQFKDGGLLCKLVNCIKPGTIDETHFNFGNNMHFLHMVDNQNKVLKGAALLGCDVSGLDPTDLATYKHHSILALLEQLFKLVTNRDVHMFRHYELIHGVKKSSSVRPTRSASLDHKPLQQKRQQQRHRPRDDNYMPALGFALQPDHPNGNRKRAGEIAREPVLGFSLHHDRPKRIHSNSQPPLGFSLARDAPPTRGQTQQQQQQQEQPLQQQDSERVIQGTRPISSLVEEYSVKNPRMSEETSGLKPFIPADLVMMNWVNFQLRRLHISISNFGNDLHDGTVYIHLMNVLAPELCDTQALQEPNLSLRYHMIMNNAKKMGISPSMSPQDLLLSDNNNNNPALNFAFIAMIYNMYGPPHDMMVRPSEGVLSAVQQSDVLRLENECFSFLIEQFKDIHRQLDNERNIRQDLEVRLNQFLTQEYLMNAENTMLNAQATVEHEINLRNSHDRERDRLLLEENSMKYQRDWEEKLESWKMHEKELELQLKSAIEEATVAKQLLDQERLERHRLVGVVSPTTTSSSTTTTTTYLASDIKDPTTLSSPTTTTTSSTTPTTINNNINNRSSTSPIPNERISNAEMEGDALLKGFVRWKKCYLILKGEYLFVFVKDMVRPKYSLHLAGASITPRTDTAKDWVIEVQQSKTEHLFLAFFTEAIWRGWTFELKKCQDRLVKFSQQELAVHGQQLQQVQLQQQSPQDEIKFRENSLWIAAALGDLQWCTALLDRGADPSLPNSYGATSLHLAANRGHTKVVEFLLNSMKSRGVLPQVINAHTKYDKSTALHMAAKNGWSDVCVLLLSYGADPMSKDAQNRLPSDMAPFDWDSISVLKRSSPSTTTSTTTTTRPSTTTSNVVKPTTTTTQQQKRVGTPIPSASSLLWKQQQQPIKAYNYNYNNNNNITNSSNYNNTMMNNNMMNTMMNTNMNNGGYEEMDAYAGGKSIGAAASGSPMIPTNETRPYDFTDPQVLAEFGLEGLVSQKGEYITLPNQPNITHTGVQSSSYPSSSSSSSALSPAVSKLQQQQQYDQQPLQAPQSPRIPGSTTPRRG